ncbi:MAG: delta-60 repeat domain-containing protein [Myxococcota bacterium]
MIPLPRSSFLACIALLATACPDDGGADDPQGSSGSDTGPMMTAGPGGSSGGDPSSESGVDPDGTTAADDTTGTDGGDSSESGTTGSMGNPDAGMLDMDFGDAGWTVVDFDEFTDTLFGVVALDDGSILAAGSVNGSGSDDFGVVRLGADGSIDMSFGTDGLVIVDYENSSSQAPSAMFLDSMGRMVLPGRHLDALAAARLEADGTPDGTFDADGLAVVADNAFSQQSFGGAVGPDDQVLSIGQYDFSLGIALFDSDGAPISTFDGDGLVATDIDPFVEVVGTSAAFVADDKILAAGFVVENAGNRMLLVRYNADGTLDDTYGTDGYSVGTYALLHEAQALAVLDDDTALIAGLAQVGGDKGTIVAHHLTDGALDMDFGTNGYVTTNDMAQAHDIIVDADGSFYVAGGTEPGLGSEGDIAVAKYAPDGSLDPSFASGGVGVYTLGMDFEVAASLDFHGDDGLVVGGSVRDTGGFDDFAIARVLR